MKSIRILAVVAVAAVLAVPGVAHAQRRGGRVVAPRTRVVVVGGYRPFYYDPWFSPYGGPYGPYGPFAPYGYSQRFFDDSASLRLEVTPKDAEVFVDGYYAGHVDDFDGVFQRLHVERGEHELILYKEGYRTVRQQILLQPNATFRVRTGMEPLQPGDVQGPRPVAPQGPEEAPGVQTRAPRGVPPRRLPPPGPGRRDGGDNRGPAVRSDAGSLALRVQPGNADIRIDGESWDTSGDDARLTVQLAPGPHHVEITRDGYRAYQADVTVRAGDTTTLNVSLSRE